MEHRSGILQSSSIGTLVLSTAIDLAVQSFNGSGVLLHFQAATELVTAAMHQRSLPRSYNGLNEQLLEQAVLELDKYMYALTDKALLDSALADQQGE